MTERIYYDVYTVKKQAEDVEGLRVTAQCYDYKRTLDFNFDCTEAFAQLSKVEMKSLIIEQWGQCEIANSLVEYYSDTRTSKLFICLDFIHIDYEVKVHNSKAIDWLKEHQPEWLEEFLEDEDLAYNLK